MQARKQFRGAHVLVRVHASLARDQLKLFSRGEGRRFGVHWRDIHGRHENANTGASMVVIVMVLPGRAKRAEHFSCFRHKIREAEH